jgi:hypothetical protein
MLRLRVAFALAALALAGGSLAAQRTKANANRSGQWIGFGLGAGVGRVGCDICVSSRPGSISGYFKVGGTLNRKLLLGAEVDGWFHNAGGVGEYLVGLAAELYYYPNPRKRLFYKAGLGMLRYQTDDGPNRLSSTAFGANFGAGYDIPFSRSVSFTPFASLWVASPGGEINYNGEPIVSDISLMLIQAGIGVSWH